MQPLWIIGSSGHGRVVVDAARASGAFNVIGVLDDRPDPPEGGLAGVPIRGPVTPATIARLNVEHAIIAIGSNHIRQEIARRLAGLVRWATVIHPMAHLAEGVELGGGTFVAAGAIVLPGTSIGQHVILNTASSIDHESIIGDFAHIAPGVRVAGNVRIGQGTLLGIGCCVLPQQSVGDWAIIGGGAVVIRSIPSGTKAIGVPARVVDDGLDKR
jgi:acetyltransferase EpsM